jgi:nitrate/nitrite transporter NarK
MTESSPSTWSRAQAPILSVLLPFALLFALGNYYRFMNAILAPHLVADLHLTASDLGLLVSAYFLVSALSQAPLGLMMDRFGPRRVQSMLIAVGGIGALIFGAATTWPIALLGRVIMGVGAAGALMTSFQAVTLWFPKTRWPLFNGIVMSVGGIGSLAATLPTQWLIDLSGWRSLMVGVAIASFAAAVMMITVVPEKVSDRPRDSFAAQFRGIGEVYRDRVFWRIAPLFMSTIGSNVAFQSLWAGTWLRDVGGLAPHDVAAALSVLTIIQIFVYVFTGFIASELNRRGVPLIKVVAVGSALYIISQMPLILPTGIGRWIVLLGMGFLSNANSLCYPVLSQHVPQRLIGRANTALNTFFFIGAFTLQYTVGVVIDVFAPAGSGNYPVIAYQVAFGAMVTIQIVSWLWLMIPPRQSAEAV